MKLPGISGAGITGGAGHADSEIAHKKPTALPSGIASSLVNFGGQPGTDLSSLLGKKSTEEGSGEKKGGLAGIASKLGDATALIPGLSNALKGAGNSDGSIGGMLSGAVSGSLETAENSVKGIAKGVMQGEVNPALMAKNALAENYQKNEQTPEAAKALAGMV
ncbi:hypothetical protein [Pseudomonas sp. LP_7_YM]|uniref:hypothetical protein n=1 Tax=Pseudomonas sp. LP_7_YM TaxID=2485137 RepID=UPI00105C68AB|nr:hypothetical protein [Pseudomonas sp. LP_7_YM]TDV60102.1 hypothetical protein EC915_11367 [Pseudomonas sp. LP_7_YM]